MGLSTRPGSKHPPYVLTMGPARYIVVAYSQAPKQDRYVITNIATTSFG